MKGLTRRSFLPVLVRPAAWSIRNRWRRTRSNSPGRDLTLLGFSGLVMFALYQGSLTMLDALTQQANLTDIPASLPLGLLFMFLFFMLLLSNAVGALSSFYFGSDLALLLASPISDWRFFAGRLLVILGGSSWMALVFGLPVILAFGVFHAAGFGYYLEVAAVLPAYFMIPAGIGALAITVGLRIVPVKRSRELLAALMLSATIGVCLAIRALFEGAEALHRTEDVLKVLALLSTPLTDWSPSYWGAKALELALHADYRATLPYLGALYGFAFLLVALAFIAHRLFHFGSYSRARSMRRGTMIAGRRDTRFSKLLLSLAPRQLVAMMIKEYRLFFRDMTQAIQLLVLLGLCIIYLYNFRVLNAVRGLPETTRIWWQSVLVIINIGMGGFVMTAVCTRFVFPSVSLEGRSYWIVQSAPVSITEMLRAKFWAWMLPVGTISSVIFASGALAIDTEPHIVVIHALVSWVLCFGIVGLAIGLGAMFANFNWEHSSQLAASVGSLVYMLSSTVFILLNLIPAGLLISLRTVRNLGSSISLTDWYLAVGSCAVLIAYINLSAMRWAIAAGANALEARRKGEG